VAKATVSPAAKRKAASKRTDEGHPVHSFRTLLTDLATLTRNTVRFGTDLQTTVLATPTTLQKHAFNLLEVSPMGPWPSCSHKIARQTARKPARDPWVSLLVTAKVPTTPTDLFDDRVDTRSAPGGEGGPPVPLRRTRKTHLVRRE
jgi:hypothetical protein